MEIDVNKPSSSDYLTKPTSQAPPPPCRDHQHNKNQPIPTTTAKDRPNANKNNQDAIPPGIQSMASMLTGIITVNEQERAKERKEYKEREVNRAAQRKLEYERHLYHDKRLLLLPNQEIFCWTNRDFNIIQIGIVKNCSIFWDNNNSIINIITITII